MMISSALTDKTNSVESEVKAIFLIAENYKGVVIGKVKCFSQLVKGGTDCTLSPLISFNTDYCKTYSRSQDHSEMEKKKSLIIFVRAARQDTECLDKRF